VLSTEPSVKEVAAKLHHQREESAGAGNGQSQVDISTLAIKGAQCFKAGSAARAVSGRRTSQLPKYTCKVQS
jgi:hypothetical protein